MYEIIGRLFNGKSLVGYRLLDSRGNMQHLDVIDVKRLVRLGRVKDAVMSGDCISLENSSIIKLPRINLKNTIHNKSEEIRDKYKIVIHSVYMINANLECDINIIARDQESLQLIMYRLGEYFKSNERKHMRIQPYGNDRLEVIGMDLVDLRMMCKRHNEYKVCTLYDKQTFIEKYVNTLNDKAIINLVMRTLDVLGGIGGTENVRD